MNTNMKPVASRFVECLMFDLPASPAMLVDFGMDRKTPEALYRAYQKGVRSGQITPDELNEALGDGPALTKLVQRINPELTVETDYDSFLDDLE